MKNRRRKKVLTILCIALAVIAIGAGGFFAFVTYQMNQIPKMTFEEMLAYTTKDNEKAVVAVGVVQNGKASYTLYGENGAVLPQAEHVFEIGSVTKTFTASLLFKAIGEGKISLDDRIDKYLDLPEKGYYPTIRRIVTHTSGYKGFYFETQMISNFLRGKNDFYGISEEKLIERVGKIDLQDRSYRYKYSNFGISVLGAVLSAVYAQDYASLIDDFIAKELGLMHTRILGGSGDLGNLWAWAENDAYMPAGALTSTIEDMLQYARLQMEGTPPYLARAQQVLAEVNAAASYARKINLRTDSIGAAWMIDSKNNIIWHNGGTGHYNCYLGFDPSRQIAVVILTNLKPGYRIPATVMGPRLLMDLQEE